jgi:hypothetical protein
MLNLKDVFLMCTMANKEIQDKRNKEMNPNLKANNESEKKTK